MKAVRQEEFTLGREVRIFILPRPSAGWMRATHVREGNLLYSAYQVKCQSHPKRPLRHTHNISPDIWGPSSPTKWTHANCVNIIDEVACSSLKTWNKKCKKYLISQNLRNESMWYFSWSVLLNAPQLYAKALLRSTKHCSLTLCRWLTWWEDISGTRHGHSLGLVLYCVSYQHIKIASLHRGNVFGSQNGGSQATTCNPLPVCNDLSLHRMKNRTNAVTLE